MITAQLVDRKGFTRWMHMPSFVDRIKVPYFAPIHAVLSTDTIEPPNSLQSNLVEFFFDKWEKGHEGKIGWWREL